MSNVMSLKKIKNHPNRSGFDFIEIQRLILVLLLNEGFDDVGVMDAGIRSDVFLDELGLLVGLGMELIAVVLLTALLRPACIGVLVALLVRLVIPQFPAVSRLDTLVLLTGVALLGSFHKGGIDNLALIEGEALAVKITTESVEQSIKCACLAQDLLHVPNGLLVRNLHPQYVCQGIGGNWCGR